MKTIFLPGVERPVSQLCLGTAYLGHREDDETSFAIMDVYYEAGGHFLNTAHEYGNGHSERVIGKWIRERGIRDEITLTSKCGEDHSKPGAVAMHAEVTPTFTLTRWLCRAALTANTASSPSPARIRPSRRTANGPASL